MSTILKNIISFSGLTIGVPVPLPHGLNINGRAVIPQFMAANGSAFTVTADATNVTVTRTSTAAAAVSVFAEHWHTIEDDEPAGGLSASFPFVVASGAVASSGAAQNGAMFFGTTTGTGSLGNDYAATVAVGAAVPFPRNGPTTVGAPATRNGASTTQFVVSTTGTYLISWQVGFSEASQLQVAVNTAPVANTCVTSGAGTQQNSNRVLVSLVAADVVTIINPSGNAAALTVTPSDGSLTHAQAPSLVITLVG